MRWKASRPTTTLLPQADLAGTHAGACDDPPADPGGLLAAAERFIALFHGENPEASTLSARMQQVSSEVKAHGTYWHTPEELAFAARVAWRNSSRCIGRLYWRTLRVRDRRQVSAADQIAAGGARQLGGRP